MPNSNKSSLGHIAGLALIIIAIFGYFFFVGPLWEEVNALNDEKDQKITDRDALQTKVTAYEKLQEELVAGTEVAREKSRNAIPETLNQDLLITTIIEKAEAQKMNITSLIFGQGITTDYGVQAATVTASVQGDYQRLVDFLKSLEQEVQRKIVVKNISVQLGEEEGALKQTNFTLSMEVYYQSGI